MTLKTCSRQRETADMLRQGHWPQGCDPELQEHIQSCSQCRDLAQITQVFQEARRQTAQTVRLDPPGVLWWRAQLRRRNAALERIAKPINTAQVFALVINLLVGVAFVASQARHGLHWLSRLADRSLPQTSRLQSFWAHLSLIPNPDTWPFIAGLATLALCSVAVVFLVAERE